MDWMLGVRGGKSGMTPGLFFSAEAARIMELPDPEMGKAGQGASQNLFYLITVCVRVAGRSQEFRFGHECTGDIQASGCRGRGCRKRSAPTHEGQQRIDGLSSRAMACGHRGSGC